MNTCLCRWRRAQTGSLLITAAVASAVISILIGGMLTYISNEYALEQRAHLWTQSLHLAEAGLEMAFAEFNNYYITGQGGFASSRGWQYNYFYNYYERTDGNFTNASGRGVGLVYSRVSGIGSANPFLQAYGRCRSSETGQYVYRLVEARLRVNTRFPAAMVAKDYLNMNGNNVYTDSFDSTDASKSDTNGLYNPATRQANGDIASCETVTNTVDITIGNADIYGQVRLGHNGSVTMGPNGSVGPTLIDADRATSVAAGQAQGWIRNDFEVDIPDVTLPSGATSWTSRSAISVATTLSSGDYRVPSIGLSGNGEILTIDGHVRLYITGNISLSGKGGIVLLPGSSLTVYCAGSCSIAGNAVVNQTGRAINNQFYGLNSSTSWSLSGNGQWIGTVYAPWASLALNGGGANGDMSGAIVANNITLNGQVQMHYDEMLSRQGPGSTFDINSWKSYRYTGSQWVAD
jgi:hypothetical protein